MNELTILDVQGNFMAMVYLASERKEVVYSRQNIYRIYAQRRPVTVAGKRN